MTTLISALDRWLYPNHSQNWDDVLFREWIQRRITSSSVVLDLGAGAGIVEQMDFKGMVAKVCGVDRDPRVAHNPMLDEGRVAGADRIPYDDAVFDVAYCDNVVEHLADPEGVFCEVFRVLKPGGYFLIKTPNRTHYMPLIARATPHRFHQFVNRLRGRAEVDTFPTLYRANTASTAHSLGESAGFLVTRLARTEGRPEYLRFAWPAYLMGAAYERCVNFSDRLAAFRILLMAEFHKPR